MLKNKEKPCINTLKTISVLRPCTLYLMDLLLSKKRREHLIWSNILSVNYPRLKSWASGFNRMHLPETLSRLSSTDFQTEVHPSTGVLECMCSTHTWKLKNGFRIKPIKFYARKDNTGKTLFFRLQRKVISVFFLLLATRYFKLRMSCTFLLYIIFSIYQEHSW